MVRLVPRSPKTSDHKLAYMVAGSRKGYMNVETT